MMRIARSKDQDGTLAPSAFNYLVNIPDNCCFLNQHARRPPRGIYNVSTEQLVADFSNLLNEYFKTREFIRDNVDKLPSGEEYYDSLLKAQKDLIHSLQAHVDDCYAILAALIDPATVPPKVAKIRFTDRWLEAIGFPTLDRFKKSISEYRDGYLAHLVNGLKHRQNRLRGIFFYNSSEVRLGYYLEEPDSDGVPGPSFDLHEDGNSAFSFAKDILFNLYHVYYLSEMLVDAVGGALQHYQSFTLKAQKVGYENDKWLDVLRSVLRIQPQVFPNELDEPYPYFAFTENDGDQSLALMYPVTLIPLKFPQGMRIFGIFKADGVSKTFRIPYLKRSKYGGIR
ncbi:MAG: hypothetical protein AABN95_27080 [Acidobacteriota bacterium]